MGSVDERTLKAAHRGTIAANRADRKRSLDALHQVEHFAGAAATGREQAWTADIGDALAVLEAALSEQGRNSGASDSPLSDIEAQEPRLRNRVTQLRQRYADLERRIEELRGQLDTTPGGSADVTDTRHRLENLAAELRYLRAREADLVYEAYSVDIGAGD